VSHPNAHRVRIIGGRYRGRVIRFPRAEGLRPTPDRVRETLFNWLGQDLAELSTLDLYAGSGALALEALSRGAAVAVAVDRDPALVRAIAETARTFGAAGLEAHTADAKAWLARDATIRRDLSRSALAGTRGHGCAACEARLAPGGFLGAESPELAPPAPLEVFRHAKAGLVHYHLLRHPDT
jgi:16S rRNA (guanine966-N2)-methyltransferase